MDNNKNIEQSAFDTLKQQYEKRQDMWENVMTNLGVSMKDKRTGMVAYTVFISQSEAEAIYQTDDIAARIVDRPPEEMTREGFEIEIKEQEKNNIKAIDFIWKEFERLAIEEKIEKALKEARLYGGHGIIIGINSQEQDKLLDYKKIDSIDYIVGLDRYRLQCSSTIIRDLTSPAFDYPEYYTVITSGVDNTKIHYTRIIRFDGVKLPFNTRLLNNQWGDSVFSRLYNVIRNFQLTHDSAVTIMNDFTQAVFKMAGLSQMIASGNKDLIQQRLKLLKSMNSIVNAIVVEAGDEYERKTTSIAGLAELIEKVNNRLVAATDIPHTILLGESPQASNATGNSTVLAWYDQIKNKQESELRPVYMRFIKLILSQANSPIKYNDDLKISINFKPLWQVSEKEQAETRFIMSQADGNYIDRTVLNPEQVARNRFANGFSVNTIIDTDDIDEMNKESE